MANAPTSAKGQEQTPAPHKIVGRIERGFGFLGYHFGPARLTVAREAIANFIEKASQERGAVLPVAALETYVKRWVRWTTSGRLDLRTPVIGDYASINVQ